MSFSKQIRAFVEKAKGNIDEVVQDASETVVRIAQERAPEDTGELKDSLIVLLSGAEVGTGREAYEKAIDAMQAGDTLVRVFESTLTNELMRLHPAVRQFQFTAPTKTWKSMRPAAELLIFHRRALAQIRFLSSCGLSVSLNDTF